MGRGEVENQGTGKVVGNSYVISIVSFFCPVVVVVVVDVVVVVVVVVVFVVAVVILKCYEDLESG